MKKHLLFILSISTMLIGSCKKTDNTNKLEGKWFMYESHIITLLKDGSPLPSTPPQHDYLDDPDFEFIGSRSDYYIEFVPGGKYRFGPDVTGTYKIDGNKVQTSTPQDEITYDFSIEGDKLVLKGIRYFEDVDLDITYKLRRNL